MDKNLEKIVSERQTVLVLGSQWGDEGKGKVVDMLMHGFDLCVRYQGGRNAGHTVVAGGRKHKLHLVPSGIVRGKDSVIADGVALDPIKLLEEIEGHERNGLQIQGKLHISENASVLMPYHIALDVAKESNGDGIGSTKNGIRCFYADKNNGRGFTLREISSARRNGDIIERWNLNHFAHRTLLVGYGHRELVRPFKEVAEEVMHAVNELYRRDLVTDTSKMIEKSHSSGRRILFETAQGVLLCTKHGTKPYVTSSHSCGGNLAKDIGVPGFDTEGIWRIAVVKAYTTRVGDGPFPTEMLNGEQDLADKLRELGGEYGTTTGRPRRVGWLDFVGLRYAIDVASADEIAVTKIDVLANFPVKYLKAAVRHTDRRDGSIINRLGVSEINDPELFENLEPEYMEIEPFSELSGESFENYLRFIEDGLGRRANIICTGPRREEYLVRN